MVSNLANRLFGVVDFDADDDNVSFPAAAPPPKLNPPAAAEDEDGAAALLVTSPAADDDNPEVNDKAFDVNLDDDDDDVPKDDPKPENGNDVVLLFSASSPLDEDLPAEGSAVMKDEPNM